MKGFTVKDSSIIKKPEYFLGSYQVLSCHRDQKVDCYLAEPSHLLLDLPSEFHVGENLPT